MTYSTATAHLFTVVGSAPVRKPKLGPNGPQPDTFTSLSPGEQRIARALYEAQKSVGESRSSASSNGIPVRSLDEIAGMERNVAGWNQVFKELKSEGLIAEQTLGHVVARWTRILRPVRIGLAERLRSAQTPVPTRTA